MSQKGEMKPRRIMGLYEKALEGLSRINTRSNDKRSDTRTNRSFHTPSKQAQTWEAASQPASQQQIQKSRGEKIQGQAERIEKRDAREGRFRRYAAVSLVIAGILLTIYGIFPLFTAGYNIIHAAISIVAGLAILVAGAVALLVLATNPVAKRIEMHEQNELAKDLIDETPPGRERDRLIEIFIKQ